MTQIFVFTAGNPEARQHLADSIENKIDQRKVFGSFASSRKEELESIQEEGRGFYAWGAVPGVRNIPNWEVMQRGDYVLCVYGNTYHYVAQVLAKYENERFARRIWGGDENGKTWKYMYFLTEPLEIYRHLSELVGYLNAEYRGFTRISNTKVDEILNDFGSVDAFIHQELGSSGSGISDALGLETITEQDMDELEDAEDLNKADVDREMETIRDKLEEDPKLMEGLDRQTTQTFARPRSAAFELGVKRLYGFRCAICGSGLRTPNGKPEVQSAHIYPKRLDGSDDVRNGICLCRKHHWAMDAGWISIDDDYTILVRKDLPNHDDYQFIAEYEGEKVQLPSEEEAAPHTVFLQQHRELMKFE